jgi:hypothetical protein
MRKKETSRERREPKYTANEQTIPSRERLQTSPTKQTDN